jgi:predicted AAA+ superfamily ATPase
MKTYLHRTLEIPIKKAAFEFPVLFVTGPRQSGKTTILQHTFSHSHPIVYLDQPEQRMLATSDPQIFFMQHKPPLILDEIQYTPELLPHIKRDVDEHRGDKGRYIISGSQSFPLMQGVTETLAGRTGILTLLSMSLTEQIEKPFEIPFWKKEFHASKKTTMDVFQIFNRILSSGFPELVVEPNRDKQFWYSSYIQTYLERDIRQIRNVGNLADFQRFLYAAAARTAQLINMSEMAKEIGVAVNTIKAWFSILEASYQIVLLKPYYENLGKRLVKMPKLYFLDPAIPAYLTGLSDTNHAMKGPLGGALFENAVFAELFRGFVHNGEQPRIFFWRTAAGHKVDFILDFGHSLIPIEVKLTATPKPEMAANLEKFSALFEKVSHSYLICLNQTAQYLTRNVFILPFDCICANE